VLAADRDRAPVADHELVSLFSGFAEFKKILIAVSGGPDSMALLLLAHRWRENHGGELIAATVDHGLRPEAKEEAALAAAFSHKLGVPHHVLRWTGEKPPTGIQEAAREARYALLCGLAKTENIEAIVTAHTRDDQSETFLMRLARGSGLSGLAGIRARSNRDGILLLRPLLDLPKARLIATMEAAGIGYAEDGSNRDPRFTRVRLRELSGALAQEGIDPARIAGVTRRLARADAAIEAAVDDAQRKLIGMVSGGRTEIAASTLFGLPDEISLRLLGRAIGQAGDEGPVELAKLESLHSALREANATNKPLKRTLAGAALGLDRGKLAVERAPTRSSRLPKE